MAVLVRITYTQSNYSTPSEKNYLAKDREDAITWASDELDRIAAASNNRLTNVKIILGAVTEEYDATRVWELKPINGTVAQVVVNRKGGLEV